MSERVSERQREGGEKEGEREREELLAGAERDKRSSCLHTETRDYSGNGNRTQVKRDKVYQ